jgi:hypothetical protein
VGRVGRATELLLLDLILDGLDKLIEELLALIVAIEDLRYPRLFLGPEILTAEGCLGTSTELDIR